MQGVNPLPTLADAVVQGDFGLPAQIFTGPANIEDVDRYVDGTGFGVVDFDMRSDHIFDSVDQLIERMAFSEADIENTRTVRTFGFVFCRA